jgi:hypothetical protein
LVIVLGCIKACPASSGIPHYIIEPKEEPLPFGNLEDFERWLREDYIYGMEHSTTYYSQNNIECVGIFSQNKNFEKCCLQYPNLTQEYPISFQESLRGKITCHNHPSGQTFSWPDVAAWATLQMQEIRVIASYNAGEYRTFLIKRLNQKFPTWGEIRDEIHKEDPFLFYSRVDNERRHRCLLHLKELDYFEYSVDPPIVLREYPTVTD